MTALNSIIRTALLPISAPERLPIISRVALVLESFGDNRVAIFACEDESGSVDMRLRFSDQNATDFLSVDFRIDARGFWWNGDMTEVEFFAALQMELARFVRQSQISEVLTLGVKASDLLATLLRDGLMATQRHCIDGCCRH